MKQGNATVRPNGCAINNGPKISAGVTLNAAAALHNPDQQHFTRTQVSYLIALAYESGRKHAVAEDMAETVACWEEFAQARSTREQRVTQRLAEMEAGAQRQAARPWRAAQMDCEWPPVTQPGSIRQRVVA